MKKYNHSMDDVFRESLADHRITPSAGAKKAFMKDAMQLPPPGKRSRKGWILLSVIIILAGAGIVIWPASDNEPASTSVNPALQKSSTAADTQLRQETPTEFHPEIASAPIAAPATHTLNKDYPVEHDYGRSDNNISGSTSTSRDPSITYTPEDPSLRETASNIPETLQVNSIPVDPVTNQLPENVSATTPPGERVTTTSPAPETIIMITDSSDSGGDRMNKIPEKSVRKKGNFNPALGLYYNPEWMFHTLEGTKYVNNFGIEATFSIGRFSIRTGAGLSIAKGFNELVVAYNDYLGAYNKLDSMDFTWSEPMKDYIPTMYTSKKDVWDSLMKLDYAKVIRRYTYLQIPLVMGYDFWQTERVSIGMRAGPVLSVLVSSKQLSAAYDPGQKRIISMNDIAPEQINLNWQVLGGLNTMIRISETLQFEIEPSVRYYFNSVYEQPVNNSKPWSFSLRAAFVIKL